MKTDTIKYIDIEQIQEPSTQLRASIPEETINELAESIKQVGLLEPIIVKPLMDEKYEIVAGHRRFLACARAGLKKIPCIVKEMNEQEAFLVSAIENLQREDLSAVEEAAIVRELREKYGMSARAVADALGKSIRWVEDRDKINEYPEDIKFLLHTRQISIRQAELLALVDREDLREIYAKEVIEGGISTRTLKGWVESYIATKAMEERSEEIERSEHALRTFNIVPTVRCQLCGGKFEIKDTTSLIICKECDKELLEVQREYGIAIGRRKRLLVGVSNYECIENREEIE